MVNDDGLVTDGETASRHGWKDADTDVSGENIHILQKHPTSFRLHQRRSVSCSPTKRDNANNDRRPAVSLSLSPPRSLENLISPSVSLARNASLSRRNSAAAGKPTSTFAPSASKLPPNTESLISPHESKCFAAARANGGTSDGAGDGGGEGTTRKRSNTDGSHQLGSVISELSSSLLSSDSDHNDPAPSPSSMRGDGRIKKTTPCLSQQKQPLLLPRGHFRQQQQQRVRPVPHGLAAAAATAAARAAQRRGTTTPPPTAAAADSDSAMHMSKANAVAAAALGAERAAGARAMHGALDRLRAERESLADACKRLEAEREVAASDLRKGAERARELQQAREALSREKEVLSARCAELEAEKEGCVKGKCSGVAVAEGRSAAVLQARAVELEEVRKETAQLVCIGCVWVFCFSLYGHRSYYH